MEKVFTSSLGCILPVLPGVESMGIRLCNYALLPCLKCPESAPSLIS